jgi:hypothetical protein
MSYNVDRSERANSWRTQIHRMDEAELAHLIDRVAPPRPIYRVVPTEAYYLEPSCTVYPGAPESTLCYRQSVMKQTDVTIFNT